MWRWDQGRLLYFQFDVLRLFYLMFLKLILRFVDKKERQSPHDRIFVIC